MEEKKNIPTEENKGLTFKDILFIIKKHWIAIVAFIVCCTAGGFIWSRVETPVYKSTGTMLVSYESKNHHSRVHRPACGGRLQQIKNFQGDAQL